jgi:hypothetical protein
VAAVYLSRRSDAEADDRWGVWFGNCQSQATDYSALVHLFNDVFDLTLQH